MPLINVLQIGMSWNIGGTESYIMQQYRNADPEKVHYDFVNINSHKQIAFYDEIVFRESKVYEICSRHLNPFKHYYQWVRLMNSIRGKYQAIVLNANSLEYVFPLVIAKIYGIPVRIIHSHNSGNQHKVGLVRKMLVSFNRILLKFAAPRYCACSEKAGRWMFGVKRQFTVIHNAIDTGKFAYKHELSSKMKQKLNIENCFVLGHVASFCYQKNNEFMIDIFNEIHKLQENTILILVGDDVNGDHKVIRECKSKVIKLGLEKYVQFLGMRTDVADLMQAMDCFALPSRFEGLPFVGIEAQASGLSCFFSDAITRELEITNLCHFIGLDKSAKEWASIILKNSTIERRDMSQEISDAGYDIKTEVKKIEKIYMKGLEKTQCTPPLD